MQELIGYIFQPLRANSGHQNKLTLRKLSIWKRAEMTVLDILQVALNQASQNTSKKVILIIDSLDQLESASSRV